MSRSRHLIVLLCLLSLAAQAKSDESTVAGLIAQGQALAEQSNHSAAIDKYDAALARDANSADAHAWKAASLIALKRLDEADGEIQKALKANNSEFTYQMIFGRLQIARGNIDEGVATCERAAKSSPPNAGKIYADLAASLASKNDDKLSPQIESALKSAASANPPHLDALFNLGQSYASAGKPEAKDYLKRYLDGEAKLPEDQRDKQKMQLARKMIRALDILNQVR